MTPHIMIDLETFGTSNDAVMLALGAVKFDPHDCVPKMESFYVAVDPASCARFGLKLDVATVMWWMDPARDDARTALLRDERVDLVSTLDGFATWVGDESLPIWGNGASFDNVILRSAYEATGLQCPWRFWHDRCYRTVKSLAPPDLAIPKPGIAHHALHDAEAQARHLQSIVARLGLKL